MPSPYDWTRGPWSRDPHHQSVPDSDLRVSNAERDEVSNALCRHFSDGRLDEAEFNERLEKCTAAKTRADLAPLLVDLPPLPGASPVQGGPVPGGNPHSHPVPPPPWRLHPALAVLFAVFVLVGVAHFTLWAWHGPWLVIAVVAVICLVVRRDRRQSHL